MTTTRKPPRTKTERHAYRCAICLPATDTQVDGGTDHPTEAHDDGAVA